MSKFAKALIAGTSAATLLSAMGYADDTTEILNGQINLDADVRANAQIVLGGTGNITLNATGIGNALDVETISGHDVTSTQTFGGFVTATAETSAVAIDGTAITNSGAYGNSAVLDIVGDSDINLSQTANDGSSIYSSATLRLDSFAVSNITAATAAANAIETNGYYGGIAGNIVQSSGADVGADAVVEARLAGLGEFSTTAAIASGNSVQSTGYESSVNLSTSQANRGNIAAAARVNAGGGGVFTTVSSQAQGNGLRADTVWAYGELRGDQTNDGQIDAETNVNIGNFDEDSIITSAEGIGNSAILTNLGTDTFLGLDQTNNGQVTTVMRFDGSAGGEVIGSSSAFGNAATSYGCYSCPGTTSYGEINQTNNGQVNSTFQSQYITGWGTTGSSLAVGNSATFVRQSGNE